MTGGFESGLTAATLARDGTLSLQTFGSVATDFRCVDLTGRDVQVPANPLSDGPCGDEPDCPAGLTIDLTGQRIAWLQTEVGQDGNLQDLVVQGVDGDESTVVGRMGERQLTVSATTPGSWCAPGRGVPGARRR